MGILLRSVDYLTRGSTYEALLTHIGHHCTCEQLLHDYRRGANYYHERWRDVSR
jgi:hypothetical protein